MCSERWGQVESWVENKIRTRVRVSKYGAHEAQVLVHERAPRSSSPLGTLWFSTRLAASSPPRRSTRVAAGESASVSASASARPPMLETQEGAVAPWASGEAGEAPQALLELEGRNAASASPRCYATRATTPSGSSSGYTACYSPTAHQNPRSQTEPVSHRTHQKRKERTRKTRTPPIGRE